MGHYDVEKLLRLAKQGKLVLLIPAVVGENVQEEDFQGEALENIEDQTITLIFENGKHVFASRSLLGE